MELFTVNSKTLRILVSVTALLLFTGCQYDLETNEPDILSWIDLSAGTVSFTDQGGSQEVTFALADGIDPGDLDVSIAANGQSWCEATLSGKTITLTMTAQAVATDRATMLVISNGTLQKGLAINQYARAIENYDDTALDVDSATATSQDDKFDINNSYDFATQTYYLSKESTTFPVTLEYTLEEASKLSYMLYYPRTDDSERDGTFGEFEVWIKKGSLNYVKVGDFDNAKNSQRVYKVNMPKGTEGVTKVKLVVKSGLNNRVSASEIKFYASPLERLDLNDIFTDMTYSQLREGITDSEITRVTDPFFRKIASGMYDGSYSTEFRIKDARPYQTPSIQATKNKHGQYSIRDNPTGIYVEAGEDMLIYLGPTKGQSISMLVQNIKYTGFGGDTYELKEGLNKIKISNPGLIYINNFTSDDIPLRLETPEDIKKAADKTVRIHFVNAYENGYFDSENPDHTQDYWVKMLRNSKSQDIDVVGKYHHVTWNVSDYLKGTATGSTPTDIRKTIANLDSLVYWEWDFMGHIKYGTTPRNRMYFRVNYGTGAAAATTNQTWYVRTSWYYYSQIFCEPSAFTSRYWGPAHEVGHTNQTTGLKWAGMTEITNNIHSQYVEYKLTGNIQHFNDSFSNATKCLTTQGQPFSVFSSDADADRDCRLVPFWQLYIYMVEVCGKKDFYKDLYHSFRIQTNVDVSGDITTGAQQLDFVRRTCDIAQLNLLDFFKKRGFLVAVDPAVTINDYGDKTFRITQAQINALVSEVESKGYPKPKKSNGNEITDLHLITNANKNNYK